MLSQNSISYFATKVVFALDRRSIEDQNNSKFIALVLQYYDKRYRICKIFIEHKKMSNYTLQESEINNKCIECYRGNIFV